MFIIATSQKINKQNFVKPNLQNVKAQRAADLDARIDFVSKKINVKSRRISGRLRKPPGTLTWGSYSSQTVIPQQTTKLIKNNHRLRAATKFYQLKAYNVVIISFQLFVDKHICTSPILISSEAFNMLKPRDILTLQKTSKSSVDNSTSRVGWQCAETRIELPS